MKPLKALKNISFAEIMLVLGLVLVGLFHEYLACAALVAECVWLIVHCVKEKKFRFTLNLTVVAVIVMTFFYGLTSLYGVDKGMSFIGFVKFLPVLGFLLILMQTPQAKEEIISHLPYIAGVMCLVSAVLMYVPVLSGYFSVSGRMAGFFQYPNAFAMFLLIAELVVFAKSKLKVIDVITMLVLLGGIVLTGSRTVFVLMVLGNIALVFLEKGKAIKIVTAAVLGTGVLAVIVLFPILRNSEIFGRFFTISIFESTFLGRLLYFRDAVPLILKNPFGLGYTGYYYLQQSVQTGVYSVKFIHNDYLQIMLDIGWVPAILFIAAVVKSILSKNTEKYKKLILVLTFLHGLFDFDLEYIAMYFVILLFMDTEGKEYFVKKKTTALSVVFGVVLCVALYCGVSTTLYSFRFYDLAYKVCPFHTENNLEILYREEDPKVASDFGAKILKTNDSVQIAYSALARYAYSQGDFGQMITYKSEIFRLAPFAYEEYEEYCYMMINGIELYNQIEDFSSAEICRDELIKAYDTVTNFDKKLSKLGARIVDQPDCDLPRDIDDFVEAIR